MSAVLSESARAKERIGQPSRAASVAAMEGALREFVAAAERGYYVLLTQAEKIFAAVTGARSARIVIHSGGAWRPWDCLDATNGDQRVAWLGADAAGWERITSVEGRQFVPVRPGGLAVLLDGARSGADGAHVAGLVSAAFDLALTACERRRVATDDGDEIEVMQRVAIRILNSHDLQEILLLITHETKRLLGADICGIMLRDGDAVVMQRCVGNFSADMSSLRMEAGQGLAGRVFATKEPCHVENYLESSVISKDFMHLARVEMVRSAVGAPLLSKEDVIGVLEVWRRQTSKFDAHDSRRLVALANLTSLAIENARLTHAREIMMHELGTANRALVERYEVIRSSAAFQHELIRLLLEGKSLANVAAKAAEHLDAQVLILGPDFELEGTSPPIEGVPAGLRDQVRSALRKSPASAVETVTGTFEKNVLLVQPVVAGSERLGHVAVLRSEFDESAQLALSQVCIATALHLLERRAAARARAETLGAVLWDLLEGTADVRRFAVARARELHVDLEGRHRVFLCALDGIEQHAANEGWSASELGARRRRIAQAHHHIAGLSEGVRLAGTRGNLVALVCAGEALEDAERLGRELAAQVAAHVGGMSVHVGISAPCSGPNALSPAYREARISLEVARQRGRIAAARYEDAGIVGVLLSLRDEADVRKLVKSILGPVLEQKAQTRDVLLCTLEAFFELNCSRQAAAKKLCVHEKTIVYRLAKIEGLTGLDLAKHEKRLLGDIALRMYRMTSGRDDAPALSAGEDR